MLTKRFYCIMFQIRQDIKRMFALQGVDLTMMWVCTKKLKKNTCVEGKSTTNLRLQL